jgi:hypothetical protein
MVTHLLPADLPGQISRHVNQNKAHGIFIHSWFLYSFIQKTPTVIMGLVHTFSNLLLFDVMAGNFKS